LESGRLGVVLEQNAEKLLLPRVKVFYHGDKRHYLPPEEIDLSRSQDRIVSHENPEAWDIDTSQWMPA